MDLRLSLLKATANVSPEAALYLGRMVSDKAVDLGGRRTNLKCGGYTIGFSRDDAGHYQMQVVHAPEGR
ncbi:MAG: hypothetical protein H6922_03635 [Pseudomonadaceae bacterium]|nr:hypothetical protein [Pseudomonadaceae bacterium]